MNDIMNTTEDKMEHITESVAEPAAVPSIEDMPTTPRPGMNVAPAPRPRPKFVEMSAYAKHDFVAAALKAQAQQKVLTGFANIDNICPLRQGLHVLGAISSLGKTTLIHQMGENAATLGSHVLFFELEQDEDALLAKSLSRRIHLQHENDASYRQCTADAIFNEPGNVTSREVQEQLAAYAACVGDRMIVYPSNADITVDTVIDEVERYMDETGEKPVVFIDYLQMLAPTLDENGRVMTDMRMNIESIMKKLQAFSRRYHLVVIMICALNRENYLNRISFSAFKESSMIEYCADVVWGMQPGVISEDRYNNTTGKDKKPRKTTDDEKNEMILKEKAKDKRIVEIVVLKNRNRPVGNSYFFEYEPRYDTFIALDEQKKPLPVFTSGNVMVQSSVIYSAETFAEWFWTNRKFGYHAYKKERPSVGLDEEKEKFAKDVPTLVLKNAMDNYVGYSQLSGYSETEIREAIEKYWKENH